VSAALAAPRVRPAPHAPAGPSPVPRGWWLALALLMALAAAALVHVGRGTGFFFDEWDWIQLRRGWGIGELLRPHNQHLSLVPVLVFKLGFATVGLESYLPYRLVLVALHLLCAGLLFAYAAPRVGAALALAGACVLLFLGPAWMDLLWAFQIGYLGSLAAGVGALLALDRRSRRGDLAAGALLVVSLASSSLGLPIWAMAAVIVLADPARRRRWPLLAVPALLYLAWYAAYGEGGDARLDNLFAAPGFIADMAAGAAGALAGLSAEWGRPLALAIAGLVAWRALTERRPLWRLVALAALPLAFWGLTALARAQVHEPAASRYLYPGALFLLLLLAEAGQGAVLSRRALVLVALAVAAITISNVGALRTGGTFLRAQADAIRGSLAALEVTRAPVAAAFQPAPAASPQITLGGWRAATRALGTPALPPTLAGAGGAARNAADDALRRAGTVRVTPGGAPAAPAPGVERAQLATARPDGPACVRASASAASASLQVRVPPGGLRVTAEPGATASVTLRRWGDAPGDPVATVAPGSTRTIAVAPDASPAPWHAGIALTGTVRICGAAR
jgi:hypothetical protein